MGNNEVRILAKREIEKLLSIKEAIEEVREVFLGIKDDEKIGIERSMIEVDEGKGHLLSMPFYLPRERKLGAKIISVFPENAEKEAKTISGIVVLCSAETGQTLCIMDAESITSLRTGAISAIAADLLSRNDSKTLALFGAGVQGRAQIEAVLEVRELEKINIFDLSFHKSMALAEALGKKYKGRYEFIPASSPEKAVADADMIITSTTSCEPVFNGNLVRKGTHVTAIGSFKPHCRELDDALMSRAKIVVDSYSCCLKEAGDILIALRNRSIEESSIYGELKELIRGEKKGRESKEEITVFKSVGLAIQDAALVQRIYENAEECNLGKMFSLHN